MKVILLANVQWLLASLLEQSWMGRYNNFLQL